ncbi:hypothetical protein TUM3794_19750 [Shewanella colwelliana]|uniref:Uncharacterized protein n=1 Tax=Shewanella colwelliana TaxID=23 RepID=A0ABQ4P071_SHECO|nr:hypothetical protein TUM3794_19750 [Shewanella colwelliana]
MKNAREGANKSSHSSGFDASDSSRHATEGMAGCPRRPAEVEYVAIKAPQGEAYSGICYVTVLAKD